MFCSVKKGKDKYGETYKFIYVRDIEIKKLVR